MAAVRAGALTVAEVLDRASDPVVARTRVRHLVRAISGLGEVRIPRVLAAAAVSRRRYLGVLGPLQREQLLALLTARPSRRPAQRQP